MLKLILGAAMAVLAAACGIVSSTSNAPDARTATEQTQALVVNDVARLRDFSLFRECDDCPEMIVLPGGEFQMGSNAHETLGPPRRMHVRRFAIGRDKVTLRQWAACVEAGACDAAVLSFAHTQEVCAVIARSEGISATGCTPEAWTRVDGPVGGLNWQRAHAFVGWLNQTAGPLDEAPYRLASEAEWEYAMRANANYPWEDGAAMCQQALGASCESMGEGRLGQVEFYNGSLRTPSGPNAFGLRDFFPTLEIVEDCYARSISSLPDDGMPLSATGCNERTIRVIGYEARASQTTWGRFPYSPDGDSAGAGSFITLRVARSLGD
ncbi:MAG: formylglycine-generating enzyme family protein [Hydrogenophilaceae bacterium]|jgi:formylglycine-generating enzyme required for sulfatase activity|nr:formylglycine-generating enzyme family protein [Hydrogenophilaceae bacterium]